MFVGYNKNIVCCNNNVHPTGTLELFFGRGCGVGGAFLFFFYLFRKTFSKLFFQQIFVKDNVKDKLMAEV